MSGTLKWVQVIWNFESSKSKSCEITDLQLKWGMNDQYVLLKPPGDQPIGRNTEYIQKYFRRVFQIWILLTTAPKWSSNYYSSIGKSQFIRIILKILQLSLFPLPPLCKKSWHELQTACNEFHNVIPYFLKSIQSVKCKWRNVEISYIPIIEYDFTFARLHMYVKII